MGRVLHELATGAPGQAAGTFDLETSQEEWSPSSTPDWLEPIVSRCTEPDPAARFQGMADLADALRQLAVDGPSLRESLGVHRASGPGRPPDDGPVRGSGGGSYFTS